MEEKQGVLKEIIFHNDDNGYTIAVMETEEEQLTIVGCLPMYNKGSRYSIKGTFKIHPSYGEQFAFSEFTEILPSTLEGIEGFLASGILKGIGAKTAKAIIKKFGENSMEILEKTPERLAEVSGIGIKKAEAVGEAYSVHIEFAKLSVYLQSLGIKADQAMKLYKAYGIGAIEIVKENPYRLVEEVYGIGFKKADTIAEKMGIARDSQFRIKSGIKYVIWYFVQEGNTFLPQKLLCEKTSEILDIAIETINDNLVELAFAGEIQIDNLEGRPVVYLYSYYAAEQSVCKNLLAIANASLVPIAGDIDLLIRTTEKETGMELSENQKKAVKSSITSGVSIITGGPGTGKTTIINSIINIFKQTGFKPAIAAPTGRAAKRITETSGHFAQTIHRLLEYYYSEDEDNMKFGKTEEDPLDYDVVIIDEASMIDLMLMQGLLKAIKPGTRLIMVGDADQLPSVGAGNVLRDIIDSEYVFTAKLTEIYRQAKESLIVVNAHKINKGEHPYFNESDKEFFLMREHNEKNMLKIITELATKRLAAYYDWIIPVRDIQILTPVRKGTLGSISLNKSLQMVFNPPRSDLEERKSGEKLFRENDKVMQIRNNYQLAWRKLSDFTEGKGIFNGDVGFVEKIDKEFGQMIVVFDDDKYVTYEFAQLDELELAYAITVHKSQGSEFPIVVMPVTWFPPVLATRNLLYTAVTRGKKLVVLVGSEDRMNAMIDNNRITERFSGLKSRLIKMLSTAV